MRYSKILALIAGLVTNVVLNRILLPRFGLAGAVTATAAANALALVVLLTLMNRLGLRRDPRVWLVCALPLALCLGPQWASAVFVLALWAGLRGTWIFSRGERWRINQVLQRYLEKCGMRSAESRVQPAESELRLNENLST